ncbi:MAG: hypothetical protein NTW37_02260 [Proteobacteria bacterium]|nr:hypothetical protein [Pseudomonadota bacterium]
MKIKSTLFAALALVVMTGVFNPVGVSDAFAQVPSTRQVGGDDARNAINAARDGNRITAEQARTLTDAVNTQNAQVTVNAQTGALVLGQDLAAAGLFGSFTAGQVAVAGFIVAGVAVLVSGNGTTATTGTTGTR